MDLAHLPARIESGASYTLQQLQRQPLSSHDSTTLEGRKGIYKAMTAGFKKAEDWKADFLPVRHITIHAVELTDKETGEQFPAIRTVAELEDGTRIAVLSTGILRAIDSLVRNFGPPPWEPALKLKLIELPATPPNRFYTLDIA